MEKLALDKPVFLGVSFVVAAFHTSVTPGTRLRFVSLSGKTAFRQSASSVFFFNPLLPSKPFPLDFQSSTGIIQAIFSFLPLPPFPPSVLEDYHFTFLHFPLPSLRPCKKARAKCKTGPVITPRPPPAPSVPPRIGDRG